uniref:Uncharacterized protein n=1 Tax=Periophthalmus magnuspinnatus TaxID=409849 RepID=A0A3B4BH31_9GOBI
AQRGSKPYYTSALWWMGVILMGVGELGNFAAYGFAPASLIAPLGCVSVLANQRLHLIFSNFPLSTGGTLAITGTYLLVTFAPHNISMVTAQMVHYYFISWYFLVYIVIEIILFLFLLFLYKIKKVKHIVIVMLLVALLASVTVISVKAVSGMITETIKGSLQLVYPIFYVMFVVMVASCGFQIKFLNQAMKMFDATEVVPINYVFFTTMEFIVKTPRRNSYCLLSFVGVYLIARNRPKIKQENGDFIPVDTIPGEL